MSSRGTWTTPFKVVAKVPLYARHPGVYSHGLPFLWVSMRCLWSVCVCRLVCPSVSAFFHGERFPRAALSGGHVVFGPSLCLFFPGSVEHACGFPRGAQRVGTSCVVSSAVPPPSCGPASVVASAKVCVFVEEVRAALGGSTHVNDITGGCVAGVVSVGAILSRRWLAG